MIASGKTSGAQYPFIIQMGDKGDPYHFYGFQTSFGAPVFKTNDAGEYTSDLAMGGSGGTDFAKWLKAQGDAGILSTSIDGDVAKQKFLDGAAAYTVTGPWNVTAFREAGMDVSVLPIPSAGSQAAQPFVGVQMFYQSAKSANPVAAKQFFNYLATPKAQEEMQKLYAEVKFNPLAGCLPMLLQMPIFMALFQVLSEMGSRTSGTTYEFYNLVPSLVMRPSEALAVGFGTFVPYLILMVIFAGATFLPMVLMQMGNKDNPQRKQTMIMAAVMSVFMLWISWSSPAGVLLFWGASSLMGIAQQQISMRIMKKRDAEAAETIEVKPIEVDVTRKQKKPRPTKKDTTKRK